MRLRLRRVGLALLALSLATGVMVPVARPAMAATTGLAAMPVISRSVPAYATNAISPASNGNAADYGIVYRGTPPTSLMYDLSSVPAAHRTQLLVAWYNDSNIWYPPSNGDIYYNNPADYTIDASAAAGGGSPPTNWVNLVTVTGYLFNSRQHFIDFTGYNWLRMRVTSVNGSAGNTDAAFKLDAHDASGGTADAYAFFGDSITEGDMTHRDKVSGDGLHHFGQLINASHPPNYPSFVDGGIPGQTAAFPLQTDPATGARYWDEFLAATPARYVSIDFGTNDATQQVPPNVFYSQMQQLVSAVEAAGRIPVIRLIPWGCTTGIQSNAPGLNQQIQALWAADPKIVHGPDLWTYFSQHQNLIDPDCIHPSLPDGALAYRQQYAQAMIAAVYSQIPPALQLFGVQSGNLGATSAVISWQTNNAANSRIDYGLTTAYGSSVSDPGLVSGHALTLAGLTATTTYHYTVTSIDAAGQTASSLDGSFTTTAPPRGWAWVQGVSAGNALIGGSSYTQTIVAPASGNFLVLSAVLVDSNSAGNPSIAAITDNGSPPSSWAKAMANTDTDLHDSGEIWYAANVTGGPTTITVTLNRGSATALHEASRIDEYSGIAASAPLDKTAINGDYNVTVCPTGTTAATTVDQELAVALYGDNTQDVAITSPAGWTERRNSPSVTGAAEVVIDRAVAIGTQSATFTTNWPTWAVTAIATFKPQP